MSEMRVEVNGGHLVVSENPDGEYAGFSITYETDNEDIIDVVRVEAPDGYERKKINVYSYSDVWDENYTDKYTLDTDEINRAIKTLWSDEEAETDINKIRISKDD